MGQFAQVSQGARVEERQNKPLHVLPRLNLCTDKVGSCQCGIICNVPGKANMLFPFCQDG